MRSLFVQLQAGRTGFTVLATAMGVALAFGWQETRILIWPILILASTIAVLENFPIFLTPSGTLTLTPVAILSALALEGWTVALPGTVLGLCATLLLHPAGAVLARTGEEIPAIAAAGLTSAILEPSLSYPVSLLIAAVAYIAVRILSVAIRTSAEEGIAWPRTVQFLIFATLPHLVAFALIAIVVAWAISEISFQLLAPMVAGTVALQIYLPRLLRGHEEQRVEAAAGILAAAVDAKDPYTAGHSEAVAQLSRRVARVLGLNELDAHRVYLAGILHDVGKTVVPVEILRKPGPLTEEELAIMLGHVEAGAEIVRSISGLASLAPIIAASHERMDGLGYPRKLAGNDIPLEGRINLVVDAYNALTTDRPYRAASPPDAALSELAAHSGTQFDPRVLAAFRIAAAELLPRPTQTLRAEWLDLLRQPAFALLWGGELVSFLGDEIFFIALSLWIYKLTGSVTLLGIALVAATVGQVLMGFVAGALADRMDRRGVIIITDLGRAAIVAALPLALPRSLPAGFGLLLLLNVGSIFFRAAISALLPTVVRPSEIPTGVALFQMTERIAEVAGGVLGAAIVVAVGYQLVFYLDALTFLVSATCVALMPVAWRVGLAPARSSPLFADIRNGLRYIWETPRQRFLALLIIPGYLTLGFSALQAPMVVHTAALSIMAYGVTNSSLGLGKLASAMILTKTATRWVTEGFIVCMYLLTSAASVLFGASTLYAILIVAAFFYGFGNVGTIVANQAIVAAHAPSYLWGRVLGSRQVFANSAKVIALLGFAHIADVVSPPFALWTLGFLSGAGVLLVFLRARYLLDQAETAPIAEVPSVPALDDPPV
jgi:putative nucleotidyltransferase with HDIG domain